MLPFSINERLSKNSSNETIFNISKIDYEKALKESGYKPVDLKYAKITEKRYHNRNRKIIWFNPPFNKDVSTSVAKKFLDLLDKHFPKSAKLHKIFNRNNVKVSYSCTENMKSIINPHNKKVTTQNTVITPPCNCRSKEECPLEDHCKIENIIYKCVASTSVNEDKPHLGTAEEFKQRFYNHKKSFRNKRYSNETTLSKYIWDIKEKYNETPSLKWSIHKRVPSYSNLSKRCLLCLHEKLEILNYPNQDQLLNKRSELISKFRHANKFLLRNYKSKD